jgi:hypothetical protein
MRRVTRYRCRPRIDPLEQELERLARKREWIMDQIERVKCAMQMIDSGEFEFIPE